MGSAISICCSAWNSGATAPFSAETKASLPNSKLSCDATCTGEKIRIWPSITVTRLEVGFLIYVEAGTYVLNDCVTAEDTEPAGGIMLNLERHFAGEEHNVASIASKGVANLGRSI